jgi:hypothetical protein
MAASQIGHDNESEAIIAASILTPKNADQPTPSPLEHHRIAAWHDLQFQWDENERWIAQMRDHMKVKLRAGRHRAFSVCQHDYRVSATGRSHSSLC